MTIDSLIYEGHLVLWYVVLFCYITTWMSLIVVFIRVFQIMIDLSCLVPFLEFLCFLGIDKTNDFANVDELSPNHSNKRLLIFLWQNAFAIWRRFLIDWLAIRFSGGCDLFLAKQFVLLPSCFLAGNRAILDTFTLGACRHRALSFTTLRALFLFHLSIFKSNINLL